ncbi:hypothetical protein B0I72DRAFT_138406 [Yarrowia lipolytica]|uniref:Secreted protein n=1 Tax=Yarrowia lipolytica TaxID=4952 RepID=A0A371C7I9_YARLL|nr:hypothetical protein BKA91DRAFT_138288 [Yarrowia lipolytica]KAE8173199.1 hypothetical protein BKA90DRAFT_136074 [Yarrowia lipolytica]RDW26266.1 hypothetical protein B0I71DRAFT_131144 [Yarrowia lipolytica]RDW32264.1 hypothetical protein B0I72DRAFT_138406 [Yarrowia lipolytica]RDW46083.1 hypothetical protein B0I74DRAFT_137538 [Yarrowia lipolytica]
MSFCDTLCSFMSVLSLACLLWPVHSGLSTLVCPLSDRCLCCYTHLSGDCCNTATNDLEYTVHFNHQRSNNSVIALTRTHNCRV